MTRTSVSTIRNVIRGTFKQVFHIYLMQYASHYIGKKYSIVRLPITYQ